MLCKDCRSEMTQRDLDGVLIDRCTICQGTWLDAGELRKLVDGEKMDKRSLVAQALGERATAKASVSVGGLCPRCARVPLENHITHGVVLDRCKSCKGLWFDHGELERVREAESRAAGSFWNSLKGLVGLG